MYLSDGKRISNVSPNDTLVGAGLKDKDVIDVVGVVEDVLFALC